MPVAELLSIFAIGAFLLWLMKSPTSRETSQTIRTGQKKETLVKTYSDMATAMESPTMTSNSVARVKCRECKVWFPRLEWMTNKECDNPNCTCPEVRKLRQATNDVINKAKESSKINIVNVKRATISPTGYEEETPQYMIDVPDVMVIDVIVPKQFNGNRRK